MFGADFQRTDDGCQLTVAPEEDSEGGARATRCDMAWVKPEIFAGPGHVKGQPMDFMVEHLMFVGDSRGNALEGWSPRILFSWKITQTYLVTIAGIADCSECPLLGELIRHLVALG